MKRKIIILFFLIVLLITVQIKSQESTPPQPTNIKCYDWATLSYTNDKWKCVQTAEPDPEDTFNYTPTKTETVVENWGIISIPESVKIPVIEYNMPRIWMLLIISLLIIIGLFVFDFRKRKRKSKRNRK